MYLFAQVNIILIEYKFVNYIDIFLEVLYCHVKGIFVIKKNGRKLKIIFLNEGLF